MQSINIRELKMTDAQALLAFEADNRTWFESHIDPRDPSFYSLEGVTAHIESYLADFAAQTWHPFVIEDCGARIVGRANLKNINSPQGSGEVGYRIDQGACGQGLATLALKRLIEEARKRWDLTQLVAYVYPGNAGSRKVVERCGFVPEQLANDNTSRGECRFVLAL
ncbi:GNAT family N-acetyltransferase [Pseudomonas sp. SMN5]|uniref:GNAT family N-acetyltransferase n=1 Tax=Pseudomonas sp. SMN5 TaxID=3390198 RepID=UPI003F83E090